MFGAATAAVVFGSAQDLNPKTIDDYVEVTASGVVDRGSSEPASFNERAGRFAAPFTAIPFPVQTCVPYEPFNTAVPGEDRDGDGVPESVSVRASAALTLEEVTVPAGTFARALRVELVEEAVVTYTKVPSYSERQGRRTVDWYASGIGPIKRYVERGVVTTTSELIAYSVGEARRGVVPVGWVARDVDEAGNNPYRPNRPALGFDGTNFLAVVPTSKALGTIGRTGNLRAVVLDREGRMVTSRALLDMSDDLHQVSLAWDGKRYLVAYQNATYGRIELLTVSPTGDAITGPILLEAVRVAPSVVAAGEGFLVSYTKTSQEPGTLKPLTNMWLATVDGQGHVTSREQPYPSSRQSAAFLAKDDSGGILALFYMPPATPSPGDVPPTVESRGRLHMRTTPGGRLEQGAGSASC